MKVGSPKMDVKHGIALDKWQEHFNSYCFESPPLRGCKGVADQTLSWAFFSRGWTTCGLCWAIYRSTQTLWACLECVWEFFLPPSEPWKCLAAQGGLNVLLPCSARESQPDPAGDVGVGCPAMELPLEWVGNSHRQSLGAIQTNEQTPTHSARAKLLLCLSFMCTCYWTGYL